MVKSFKNSKLVNYHYFDSKEAIINELFKGIVRFHSDEILKGFDSNEILKVRFQRVWKNFIQFAMNYSKAFQFIEQKLFIELESKLMVQMHYGSMVYFLKSYLTTAAPMNNMRLNTQNAYTKIGTCVNCQVKNRWLPAIYF